MLKSRTWLRALCEWGSVWIKSDAKDPNEPGYVVQEPDDRLTDPAPAILEHAVVIQASRGKTQIKSKRRIHIKCEGPTDINPGTEADILLDSKSHDVVIKSGNSFNAFASRIGLTANYLVSKIQKVKWLDTALFDINGTLVIRGKKLSATDIDAESLRATVIAGSPVGVMVKPGGPHPKVAAHNNHVRFLPDNFSVALSSQVETDDFTSNSPGAVPVIGNAAMSFKFVDPQEYNWDSNETSGKNRYKSPTQQNMTIAKANTGEQDLKEWDWSAYTQKLKAAPETDSSSTPYGYKVNFNTHTDAGTSDGSGVLMSKVQNTADVKNSATGWTSKPMKFIFRV